MNNGGGEISLDPGNALMILAEGLNMMKTTESRMIRRSVE